ncbi:sulfotransferase domain-containing protein [Roseomonas sp. CAU 1739]|uniref:sulfotransferase domain-containing protein n=1 Tax=Roseomonas sp. CAU 1739 TaxID=3140364 RepID=UPI00325B6F39
MPEILKLQTFSGQPYEIAFDPTDREDSIYTVALHKSGSVLFDNLVKAICKASGRSCVDIEVQLFRQGLNFSHCDHLLLDFCGRPGFVYSGFRGLWQLMLLRRFRDSRKLMLVRDPRDIAISFYHSMAKSHTVPDGAVRDVIMEQRNRAQAQGPSDYVLSGGVDGVFSNFNAFAMLSRNKAAGEWRIYRYEDVIYTKIEWARDIARQLNVELSEDAIAKLVAKEDVFPETEDPSKHIRRVHPGGYREALTPEAIAHIERYCAKAMAVFGYDMHAASATAGDKVA